MWIWVAISRACSVLTALSCRIWSLKTASFFGNSFKGITSSSLKNLATVYCVNNTDYPLVIVGSLADFPNRLNRKTQVLQGLQRGNTKCIHRGSKTCYSRKIRGYLYSLTLEYNYMLARGQTNDYITFEGQHNPFSGSRHLRSSDVYGT